MAIDLGDIPSGTEPTTAEKLQIRSAIGVGTTDAPTFLAQTLTGQSLTGTQATSLVDMAATWNTSGTPSALKLNVTDTASNAASKLLDLQVGGASKFFVGKTGETRIYKNATDYTAIVPGVEVSGYLNSVGVTAKLRGDDGGGAGAGSGLFLGNTGVVAWHAALRTDQAAPDTILVRDGAPGILAQRNGTSAQAFRVYDTYDTAGTNYERGTFGFPVGTNTLRIGTEQAGTGAAQPIEFVTGGAARWQISAAGHLLSAGVTDGLYDIGASGANRPRNIYVAGSINVASAIIGAGQTGINSSGVITMLNRFNLYPPSDGVLSMSNNAGTGFTRLELGSTNLGISRGTGSPEGVVTALVGSLYIRTDGGASTTLYVKESSPTPSTGWVAK